MPDKSWRFLVLKDLEPARVQAIYHAVAVAIPKESGTNVILLTTTNKSSFCCGFHQDFFEEVNVDFCKKNGIELVRRMPGGGLVLLDENQVFFNVILAGHGFPSPIKNLYEISLKGPNQFLKNVNLDSRIVYNEIQVRNKKISGTAAASIENAGVVVGNILLDFDHHRFCQALNVPNETFRNVLEEELKKNLTTLKEELENAYSIDETIEGLKHAFETTLKRTLIEDELKESEIAILQELEDEYRSDKWNFRKKRTEKMTRTFIKIKKGTCLIHHEPTGSEILISDGIISKVISNETAFQQLVGINVQNLPKQFHEFEEFSKFLLDSHARSNI
ncbi:MAG: lipoate--protein ligase family protein [Candidatus Helarchaeales archaeon]